MSKSTKKKTKIILEKIPKNEKEKLCRKNIRKIK